MERLSLVPEPTELRDVASLHGVFEMRVAVDDAAIARGLAFHLVCVREEPVLGFGAVARLCGWKPAEAADVAHGRVAPEDWEALWTRLGRRP